MVRLHPREEEVTGISAVYPIMIPAAYALRTVNCYLLLDNGSLSLIDSGFASRACWEALATAVEAHGFAFREIDRILLTHSHPDHMGLAGRVAALRSIPVYAHREAIPRLRREEAFLTGRIEFFRAMYRSMGCGEDGERETRRLREALADRTRQRIEGEIVPLEDGDDAAGLEVIYTPGHAPDHVAFRHPTRRWLFGGDLLLGHMSSNALVEPDASGRRLPTVAQYIGSLRRAMEVEANIVYPGHGEPIRGVRELCRTRLRGIGKRAEKIRGFVAGGLSVPKDIAVAYYKELYREQFAFVMSETIGYLDYLELEGRVRKERIGEVWHYAVC